MLLNNYFYPPVVYQKDFILFLIEQFTRLIRKILATITNQEYDDAAFQIEQVYRQYLGLNSDLINAFSYASLMDIQKIDKDTYEERCIVLVELLSLEGKIFLERKLHKESFNRYLKAINILLTLFIADEEKKLLDRYEKVNALREILDQIGSENQFEMSAETKIMLTTFRKKYE